MRLIDANVMIARLEKWNTNDSTDKALYNFTLHRILEQPTIEPEQRWIPISEGLPKQEKGTGPSNWHTKRVLVYAYGNAGNERYENFDYEILTGRFIEIERLCFEPDNVTLFIPEKWQLLDLDENFKCHMSIDECTYYTDDTYTQTEFHDRYIQLLAWMPMPWPMKEVSNER